MSMSKNLVEFRSALCVRYSTSFYILINLIASIIIFFNNALMGDMNQSNYSSDWLILFSFLALSASVIAVHFLYNLALKIPSLASEIQYKNNFISIAVGFYILAFIFYVDITGAFIAASNIRGGDSLSAIFTIFSPDALFLLYFGSRSNRRWNDPVLMVWIISSLQRGWFSFVFPLIVLKFFELLNSNRIRANHLLIFIFILAVYPFFDIIKVYIRLTDNFNLVDMFNNLIDVSNNLEINYVNTTLISCEMIIGRLQLVSHITYIADNLEFFSMLLLSEHVVPFWKEGVYGVAWDKLLGVKHPMEIPQALAAFINPELDGSWNVNPSIIGWLMIYRSFLPAAIIYICVLSIFFVWVAKSISKDPVFLDFVYFLLLSLLIPGWAAQLINFVNTFFIYLIIKKLFNFFKIHFEVRKFIISKRVVG
jgi:hypothetical protein